MKNRYFGKNIEPACAYCARGAESADKTFIICKKKGVVMPYFSCRKFDYDPLRRIPSAHKKIESGDKYDFSL